MKKVIFLLIAVCGVNVMAADDIVADGAKLELLSRGFSFTEGPAVDAKGNVYFTDQPNDRILIWGTNDVLSVFMKPCGRSNGLYFEKDGDLIACADENNELWEISMDGSHKVIVRNKYKGKLLNAPNDVWIRPDGGLYFTDPFYKRNYWKRGPKEQDVEAVYYLGPDRGDIVRVAGDLVQPNGIIGTPDGRMLYVADIRAGKTYRYKINKDGSLADKTLFCEMGSDGMTIDNEGNVYLTGRGVSVFDSKGEKIRQIDVPEGWTANVCFGGKDMKTLFITASKGLYSMKMRVAGVR